jgi:hypothetical protein
MLLIIFYKLIQFLIFRQFLCIHLNNYLLLPNRILLLGWTLNDVRSLLSSKDILRVMIDDKDAGGEGREKS